MKWLVLVNHKIYKWTSLALKEQRKHHKKLLGSLFIHLFHYANKNVLVKPLSLFCITSVFFTIQSKAGTIDSYWMRLNMISWRKLRSDLSAEGKGWGTRFDNSWYHAKTTFNNCFITHFWTLCKKDTSVWVCKTLRTLQGQGAWKLGRLWTWQDKCNICSRLNQIFIVSLM